MKELSIAAKRYIPGTLLIGVGMIAWTVLDMDWGNVEMYLLAALAAIAQTVKVEGPNARTNYSIAWFVYGFAFLALGPAAVIFIMVLAHLVEWAWHKYPWYIQSFNIRNHVISAFVAGAVFETIRPETPLLDLRSTLALVAAGLIFVLVNHFRVGLVVKFARGQSFAESGVFDMLPLSLDLAMLLLGAATALAWSYNPFLAVLNLPLLYPLYQALRIPAFRRQWREMEKAQT